MNTHIVSVFIMLLISGHLAAQSPGLEVEKGGIQFPQLTTAERDALAYNPQEGLTIYNLDVNCLEFFNGSIWYNLCEDDSGVLCNSTEDCMIDECIGAYSLPVNYGPCGTESREAILNNATTSGVGPLAVCKSTFQSNDVWFKVVVPTTGAFLLLNRDSTNANLYAEAYRGCPDSIVDTLVCHSINTDPRIMLIAYEAPGTEIYFRLWDSLNSVVNQPGEIAKIDVSAHRLSQNPVEWELCDNSN